MRTSGLTIYSNLVEHDNERLRHIRLHERVNDLPDPNYSTLKYFMGHLHKYVMPAIFILTFDL